MHRTLSALVALISLLAINIRPSQAQNPPGQAVDPTEKPQPINERADGGALPPAPVATGAPKHDEVVVEANQTVKTMTLHNQTLVVKGHITGDVYLDNSDVIIKPGGKIDGKVVTAEKASHPSEDTAPAVVAVQSDPSEDVLPPPTRQVNVRQERHPFAHGPKKGDWFGGQFALLTFGLIGGVILMVVAPRATHQITGSVAAEPARCLVVGGLGAVGMLVLSLANAALFHSPARLVWAPFGAVVALAPLAVLAVGWLCGLRFAGDLVARRFGQSQNGSLYGRMALGLIGFFAVNLLLGALGMGGVGLLTEFVFALMGLGAVLITGFGSDPDWLSLRLRGDARWFSRRR